VVSAARQGTLPTAPDAAPGTCPVVAVVNVTPATANALVGSTATFHASALDLDGNAIQNARFTWSSSDPNVATVAPGSVSADAVATGVAAGTARISAKTGGQSGSAQFQVGGTPGVLVGRVYDAVTNQGIANATLSFLAPPRSPNEIGTATTQADGSFTSPPLAADTVDVRASAGGYVPARAYANQNPPGQTTTMAPMPLVPASASPGGIAGTVRNARDATGIPNAYVTLYADIRYSPDTSIIAFTTTDASGAFAFTSLAAGTYTIEAITDGFDRGERTGVAVGNTTTGGQDVFLSPVGSGAFVRIVLSWGSTPPDLDAHLTGPNEDGTRFHVWYNERLDPDAPPYAGLDHDDTDGGGPETITITRFNSGNYRYSVHDYTNRESSSSNALASSGARVEVYTSGAHRQEFFVPNQAGTLWTVFEMTGTIDNPQITPRNEMTYASDPAGIQSVGPGVVAAAARSDAALIGRAARAHAKGSAGVSAKSRKR
jgi:hypothetical protein